MSSLASDDAKQIAIEWVLIDALVVWTFSIRISDERVDGAVELVGSIMPVQAIVPALIADQFLRELFREVSQRAGKISLLRFDQLAARIHGGNFILANAAEKDLVFARGGVEIPGTVAVHQGNRKRPILGADNER